MSADFFFKFLKKKKKKNFQEYHQCQKTWIHTTPDVTSGLILAKTVCKGYQQTTHAGKE